MSQHFESDFYEAVIDLSENGSPVGGCMGPRELHSALWMPFGREEGGAYLCLLRASLIGMLEMQGEITYDGRGGGEMEGHELSEK